MVAVTPPLPSSKCKLLSFGIKFLYAPQQELQMVSSSLGHVSLSITFFTALLAAAMVESGTTVDSKLFGLGRTESVCSLMCTYMHKHIEVMAHTALSSHILNKGKGTMLEFIRYCRTGHNPLVL